MSNIIKTKEDLKYYFNKQLQLLDSEMDKLTKAIKPKDLAKASDLAKEYESMRQDILQKINEVDKMPIEKVQSLGLLISSKQLLEDAKNEADK